MAKTPRGFKPTTKWIWWPDAKQGPWRLAFHWDLVDGRIECVGFDVHSFIEEVREGKRAKRKGRAPARPVDTSVLRSIPLSTLIAEQRPAMAQVVEEMLQSDRLSEASHAEIQHQLPYWRSGEGGPRRGRKGYPIEHFQEVARIYLAADGVRPTIAVKEHWSVEKSTAAKWVARARALDLIPPTTRGAASRPPITRRTTK